MYQEIAFLYAIGCFIFNMVDAGIIINYLINFLKMNITLLEVLASGIFGLLQLVTLGLIVYIWQTAAKRTEQNSGDIRELQVEVGEIKYNYIDRFDKVGVNIGEVHTQVAEVRVDVTNIKKSMDYIITKIDKQTDK